MSRQHVTRGQRQPRGLPVKAPAQRGAMENVNVNAAGIDIGATVNFVAVPEGRDAVTVRSFGTFTADLIALADWLKQCGVTTVAMESTGIYWIPLYELLESRGFDVLLAEPSQIKKVPGRKSDVLDCQWIQRLHSFGLLRGSFRPADVIVVLRSYLRQREMLVQGAAAHVQHMQKALELMNVKLTEVLDDITGLAGRQIIESILEGKRDPVELAKLRDPRCQRREETIALALQGNWRDEHLFALRQGLELYRVYQQKLHELDQQIETHLKSISASCVLPPEPLRPRPAGRRGKSRNEPAFDLRTLLHRLSAVDLTTINGIGPHAALQLISEIGTDMTAFPSVKHFCSWLCLCPGTNKTGGRTRSRTGKTRPSANRAARVLRLCAQSVIRANCALGAFGRRLKSRLGAPKAVTAVAHKLAKLVYALLSTGRPYTDEGAATYEQRFREHQLQRLAKQALKIGYTLQPSA